MCHHLVAHKLLLTRNPSPKKRNTRFSVENFWLEAADGVKHVYVAYGVAAADAFHPEKQSVDSAHTNRCSINLPAIDYLQLVRPLFVPLVAASIHIQCEHEKTLCFRLHAFGTASSILLFNVIIYCPKIAEASFLPLAM
jgi:hypothetical protein